MIAWTLNQELQFFVPQLVGCCSIKQDAPLTTIDSNSYKICVLDAEVEGRRITHERQGGG